ncbi:hypothetical protein LPJ61_000005 [Coemansia biformis]|uniref:G protein-coupled receptor n=1 Tax=Coemansia biformis TaxID=1286918 RepID=A0A9W7YCA5_9FUNG|nr:hypothetical protein LPJ61_000005 [Coemansia biformis]
MFSHGEYIGLYTLNSFSILCSLAAAIFIHLYRNDITVMAATQTQHQRRQQQRQQRPQRQRSIMRPIGTQAKMYLSLPASLRLLFIASVVDVLYSVFRMYYLGVGSPGFGGSHEANCKASMTGMTFFNLMSVFVRALVCVHLQLAIFTSVGRVLHYERQFLVWALLISLVLAVLPLFTHNYTWMATDPMTGSARCGYFQMPLATAGPGDAAQDNAQTKHTVQAALKKGLVLMWVTDFACVTLTVAYCAVVILSVVIRLVQQHITLTRISKAQNLIDTPAQQRHEFLRTTARVVRRILQFPLMIFVCHALEVVYGMVVLSRTLELLRSDATSVAGTPTIAGRGLGRLYLASHMMLGMEGIITLLFLPLEPPIRLMLRTMYLQRRAELHRLGTMSRSAPRRRVSERWPSARPPPVPSPDVLTLSSFRLSLDGMPSTHTEKHAEAPAAAPMDRRPPILPASDAQSIAGGDPGPAFSAVVDHVVTHVRRAGDGDSDVQPAPTPLRRATVRWARRLQGKEDAVPPPVPPPVHRSHTLAELPWDIVAVPRRRSRTGSVVMETAPQTDATSPALALRDDGLPALRWYVPQAPADPDTDSKQERAGAGP